MQNDKRTDELEEKLHAAERERDAALAENATLKQKVEWMRAAHMLIAQDEVFVRAPGNGTFVYNTADATVIDGEPALCVLCSDTFAYACADAEDATYADATELLRLGVSEGWPGLVRWVQSRRHEKGDPCDPIVPVRERMATMDSLRERAEKAESERDAALAIVAGSTTPPTDEEADALAAQGGAWLYLYQGRFVNVLDRSETVKCEAQGCRDGIITGSVWWPLDAKKRFIARDTILAVAK